MLKTNQGFYEGLYILHFMLHGKDKEANNIFFFASFFLLLVGLCFCKKCFWLLVSIMVVLCFQFFMCMLHIVFRLLLAPIKGSVLIVALALATKALSHSFVFAYLYVVFFVSIQIL
jgi:hypothetical protein